jgi:hypothetical protein
MVPRSDWPKAVSDNSKQIETNRMRMAIPP